MNRNGIVQSLFEKWSRSRPVFVAVFLAPVVLAAVAASAGLATPEVAPDELRIDLTSSGFVPAEVQHAAGTFAIAVENSTFSGAYTLRLKAEDGTVLKEIEVQKGSAAWTVSLQAGQYTLTEASHPEWLCRITVQ